MQGMRPGGGSYPMQPLLSHPDNNNMMPQNNFLDMSQHSFNDNSQGHNRVLPHISWQLACSIIPVLSYLMWDFAGIQAWLATRFQCTVPITMHSHNQVFAAASMQDTLALKPSMKHVPDVQGGWR
jgi:hypothetical protein